MGDVANCKLGYFTQWNDAEHSTADNASSVPYYLHLPYVYFDQNRKNTQNMTAAWFVVARKVPEEFGSKIIICGVIKQNQSEVGQIQFSFF